MSNLNTPDSENPRKIEFYNLDPSSFKGSWRELLLGYSGIPGEEVNDHVEIIVSISISFETLHSLLVENESISSGKIFLSV
jgi:hypothetical protein